jgi:hypothetical protein
MTTDYSCVVALTSDGWVDTETAWKAAVSCEPLINLAVGKALVRSPEYRERREELCSEVLFQKMKSVIERRGLPSGGPLVNQAGWAWRIFHNQAVSILRIWRRRDRHEMARERLEQVNCGYVASHSALLELSELGVSLERLPPRYALSWALLHAPALVTAELVSRASQEETRGHGELEKGLQRPAAETWQALKAWRQVHAQLGERESRRILAWILRSSDRSGPERWWRRCPEEAHRARETVGKWARRAASRLEGAA